MRPWGKGDSGLSYFGINENPLLSSYGDWKMPERQFDQTKPSYKSLNRWEWFSAPLVKVSLSNSKRKLVGLQFTSTDYLSLLLTPLRIRWTLPISNKIKVPEEKKIPGFTKWQEELLDHASGDTYCKSSEARWGRKSIVDIWWGVLRGTDPNTQVTISVCN